MLHPGQNLLTPVGQDPTQKRQLRGKHWAWTAGVGHHNGDRASASKCQPSPGYGTLPLVVSSVKRMPKDQTSDLMVNLPYRAASGAVHLMGNFAPGWRGRVRGGPRTPVQPEPCAGSRHSTPWGQWPLLQCQQPWARTLPSRVLVVLDESCQAKISHFAHQVLPHQDVGCPEVPVDVVHPLHIGHARCNLWGPARGALWLTR